MKSFPLYAVLLSAFGLWADYPKPDTTKATVIDDLSVLGDEGRTPPTVGSQLLDIINKTATVPIRIEKTETKDGNVRWQPLGYNP